MIDLRDADIPGINNDTAQTWYEQGEIVYGVMHLVTLPEAWERNVNKRLDALQVVLNIS